MATFQIVVSPDVVDVLRHEHEQLRRLCADVREAGGDRRGHALAALRRAFHLHHVGEIAVAHPAVRNSGPHGDAVALDHQAKGEHLDNSLAELGRTGVRHPDFDARFAAWSDALLAQTSDQEKDEFPLLRRHVSTSRLHMMAGALQDVRIMAALEM